MSTITKEQEQSIAEFLVGKHIPAGLGSRDEACSIAAINLALTGYLIDLIPACMSARIGNWIIVTQDVMSDKLRNSAEWRALLPLAAGTGRDPYQEDKRLAFITSWVWESLAIIQPVAEKYGFGEKWLEMTTLRTTEAAEKAAQAAQATSKTVKAVEAVKNAGWGAMAANSAAHAAGYVAQFAWSVEAVEAAKEAALFAKAAECGGRYTGMDEKAVEMEFWQQADPVGLLKRLIEVGS